MEHLTILDFEEYTKKPLVLVEFWAEWCGPCKMMKPILTQLEEQLPALTIGLVNADLEKELVEQLDVTSIPTVFLFKDGELVWTHQGAKPFPWYVEKIAPYV